jgi:hypothetical protein
LVPFEISCHSCGSVVRTTGARVEVCPDCGAPIEAPLNNDRRSHRDLAEIRDWVTSLRVNGADFSRDAAIAAREAAWNARRSGGSLEDAFQVARLAYYDALRLIRPKDTADV